MRRRTKLIYLPALLMDMSTSSALLGMPFYASSLGASPFAIGLMASSSTLLFVIFTRVFGRLSDRIARKRVPQFACLCYMLLYLAMPLCRNLWQLSMLFPLNGLILAGFWPAFEALIGELNDGKPLAKRIRFFNLAWTCGVMVGYVSGGYVYELHYSIPFYFASLGAFISFTVISIQTRSDDKNTRSYENNHLVDSNEPSKAYRMTMLYASWVANFSSWLTLGVIKFIFPKLISQLGMSASMFGKLMLCWSGVQFIMFYMLGSTKRWHYRFSLLMLFQALGLLGFIIIWRVSSPIIWVFAFMLFGLCTGMTYFSSIYYSLHGHDDLGNKSGWHESILSSGGLFGPFIAGALANYVSDKSPYLFCSIIIAASLIVQASIIQKARQRQAMS